MKLHALRRRRFGVRMALLLVVTLLFQHAAIAAYACPVEWTLAPPGAGMSDCGGMAEPDPPVVCEKHCNPDDSTTADARAAALPPAALPPVKYELARLVAGSPAAARYSSVPVSRSDPPPIVRFCSLLL